MSVLNVFLVFINYVCFKLKKNTEICFNHDILLINTE